MYFHTELNHSPKINSNSESDGPIFILGCSKSGTSMIRNLFDGHPNLFIVPAESHFFQNIGFWISYFSRRSAPQQLSYQEMKTELFRWIDYSNIKDNITADGFTKGRWNMAVFKESLMRTPVNSLRELSDLYIQSMYKSIYERDYDNSLRFMEKSVENTEVALEWLSLYPDAKFVHILRNPYSNIVALRKFLNTKKFPFLKGAIYSMYNSYYSLYKNINLISDSRYKVIIYDELISEPKKVMKNLCEFLNIEYMDILLTPTLFGVPWSGNSTSGVQFEGISNINLNKWKKELSNFEICIINDLFMHVVKDFGFEKINSRYSIMQIAKNENMFNYIQNRIFYYNLPRFANKRRARMHDISEI